MYVSRDLISNCLIILVDDYFGRLGAEQIAVLRRWVIVEILTGGAISIAKKCTIQGALRPPLTNHWLGRSICYVNSFTGGWHDWTKQCRKSTSWRKQRKPHDNRQEKHYTVKLMAIAAKPANTQMTVVLELVSCNNQTHFSNKLESYKNRSKHYICPSRHEINSLCTAASNMNTDR
jgi:hypothetical protein